MSEGWKRYRGCARKRRYPTLAIAQHQRDQLVARGRRLLKVYQCDYCGGWHLTHHNVKAWPPR